MTAVHLSRRYLAQCYASLVSRLAICSTVGQVWAVTERLDALDALLERTQGEAMTTISNEYVVRYQDTDLVDEFTDLGDALEWMHVHPGGELFSRTVTTTVIRGEWAPVPPAARERRGNHITGTVHGTVVQAGNIDGGVRL